MHVNAWHSTGVSPWTLLAKQIYSAVDECVQGSDHGWDHSELANLSFLIPSARRLAEKLWSEQASAEAALSEAIESG